MANTAMQLHNEDTRDRAAIVDLLKDVRHFVTAREIRSAIGLSGVRIRQLCQIYPMLLV